MDQSMKNRLDNFLRILILS